MSPVSGDILDCSRTLVYVWTQGPHISGRLADHVHLLLRTLYCPRFARSAGHMLHRLHDQGDPEGDRNHLKGGIEE